MSSRRRRIPSGASPMDWRYLQETLAAPITVFVPPHNALSKRGLAAVSGAGLNLLGSFLSFRPSMRPWDPQTLRQLVARPRLSIARPAAPGSDRFVYPHVLRYRRHCRVWLPQPDSRHDRR